MDVAVMAGQLLGPLKVAVDDRSHLWRLLHQLAEATDVDETLAARFADLSRAEDLVAIAELLAAFTDPDDPREAGDIVGELVPLVESVVDAVRSLADLAGSDVAGLIAPMDDPATWTELAQLLPGYLLGRFLSDYHPVLAAVLTLLGTTRDIPLPDDGGYLLLDLEAVGTLLADANAHLRDAYGWGGDFDYPLLVDRIAGLADALHWQVYRSTGADGFDRVDAAVVAGLIIRLGPALDADGRADGIGVSVGTVGTLAGVPLGADWTVTAGGGDSTFAIRPNGVTGPVPDVTFTGHPATPWALLGAPTATRLELGQAAVTASVADGDPRILLDSTGLALVLGSQDADSFLARLLGGELRITTDLAATLSMRDGVSLSGAAGFVTSILVQRSIGPVFVDRLGLAFTAGDGGVDLVVTLTFSAVLGPVQVAVDGIGVRATLSPAADGGTGQLGNFDLAVGFQPPVGAGLGIDAGAVSGGGYLYLDREAGSYAGVLNLQVLSVGIGAVGIIDTKAPGVDGWSMFFAIFLGLPSIQLGFGFTLTGAGGMAGVNRTIYTPALQSVVLSGALDSVLFPPDPIASAPTTIAALQDIFPPANDQYVFGPIVRIGWGTPSLIEATVGVAITVPDPIIIVVIGTMSSALPTSDLDLVALHLDVAGIVDFSSASLSIFSSLHDSRIAYFALSGDMALLASFGDAPNFLMAMGGFYPGFIAPGGFPTMHRLTLGVSAAPVLDIHFSCYFALTSNTVQFGAEIGLSAEVEGFGIEGGTEFDALVFFNPFAVTTHLGFHVAVTAAGLDLIGVWLDVTVGGPNPWRVVGEATFKVLGVPTTVHVNEVIGATRAEPPLESADLLSDVIAALTDPDAWAAVARGSSGVRMTATSGAADALAASPDGTVEVSQKAVPLDIALDKAGERPVGGYNVFHLEPAAGSVAQSATVTDWFPPGFYFDIAPRDLVSSPSFEQLGAGAQFGGGTVAAGPARTGSLEFEQVLRDPELAEDRVEPGPFVLNQDRRPLIAATVAAARPGFTVAADPAPVAKAPVSYAVVNEESGNVRLSAGSWSAAHQSYEASRPAAVVVPSWEIAP